jgi:anti-sigma factor RsiW
MSGPNDNGGDEERMVQYVLGELPRGEAEAFERRLAANAALSSEVRRLRNTIELLPYASVTEPPPGLRAAVLRAAEKQAGERAGVHSFRRISWTRFALAASILLALIFGIDSYRLRSELDIQRDANSLVQEPNVVRSFELAATGSLGRAYGAVILDLDGSKGAVVLRRMPQLPSDRVYRLWARVGESSVPCADFVAAADGAVRTAFHVPVASYTAPIRGLFVTVEPRGAGERPTGPAVLEST